MTGNAKGTQKERCIWCAHPHGSIVNLGVVFNLEINALGFNDEADDNFNQRWDLSVGLHFSNYDGDEGY